MTSNITESWNQILAWIRTHAPAEECVLNPPAADHVIADAARQMGVTFPEDLTDYYRQLDGAESCAVFPSLDDYDQMAYTPLPLEEAVREWTSQKKLLEFGQFDDCQPKSSPGVANVWWHTGWIPFASNGGGDSLCIDTAPAAGGGAGQVISHNHESGRHKVLATSLFKYLSQLGEQLAAEQYTFDKKYGVVAVSEAVFEEPPREDLFTGMSDWHYYKAVEAAEQAYKNKDWPLLVAYLARFESRLEKLMATRLAFAKKKTSGN